MPVVDSDNDTIVAHIRRGQLSLNGTDAYADRHPGTIAFLRGHEEPRPGASPIQINLPLMHAGGIDTGFFAIDVTLARGNHLAYALDGFGFLLHDLDRSGAEVTIVRRSADVLRAKEAGRPGALLAIEHADGTERSLNALRAL